jgi:hypothetical protein
VILTKKKRSAELDRIVAVTRGKPLDYREQQKDEPVAAIDHLACIDQAAQVALWRNRAVTLMQAETRLREEIGAVRRAQAEMTQAYACRGRESNILVAALNNLCGAANQIHLNFRWCIGCGQAEIATLDRVPAGAQSGRYTCPTCLEGNDQ